MGVLPRLAIQTKKKKKGKFLKCSNFKSLNPPLDYKYNEDENVESI